MQELDGFVIQNAFIEYVPMPGTASGKEEDTDGLIRHGPLYGSKSFFSKYGKSF